MMKLLLATSSHTTVLGWLSGKGVLSCGRSWVASQPGHTKKHNKNGTNCLPARHACVSVGV